MDRAFRAVVGARPDHADSKAPGGPEWISPGGDESCGLPDPQWSEARRTSVGPGRCRSPHVARPDACIGLFVHPSARPPRGPMSEPTRSPRSRSSIPPGPTEHAAREPAERSEAGDGCAPGEHDSGGPRATGPIRAQSRCSPDELPTPRAIRRLNGSSVDAVLAGRTLRRRARDRRLARCLTALVAFGCPPKERPSTVRHRPIVGQIRRFPRGRSGRAVSPSRRGRGPRAPPTRHLVRSCRSAWAAG